MYESRGSERLTVQRADDGRNRLRQWPEGAAEARVDRRPLRRHLPGHGAPDRRRHRALPAARQHRPARPRGPARDDRGHRARAHRHPPPPCAHRRLHGPRRDFRRVATALHRLREQEPQPGRGRLLRRVTDAQAEHQARPAAPPPQDQDRARGRLRRGARAGPRAAAGPTGGRRSRSGGGLRTWRAGDGGPRTPAIGRLDLRPGWIPPGLGAGRGPGDAWRRLGHAAQRAHRAPVRDDGPRVRPSGPVLRPPGGGPRHHRARRREHRGTPPFRRRPPRLA
ncbi:MAG: hypothetical protein H6Q02_2205 [Acidobacteria bacterium]|nr:hypothetical protein [Acidobacteriota bacterium]